MKTKTLLPNVRVTTYDLDRKYDKLFKDEETAREWITKSGTKSFNLYRIERVNGTWRTDWELEK